MTDTGKTDIPEQYGKPAVITRLVGWSVLAVLAAFLINNILIVGYGFGQARLLPGGNLDGLVTFLVYAAFLALAAIHVLRTQDTALRWDAWRISRANFYLLRGFYFAILFVGLADVTIAVLRVEKIFELFVSHDMVRNFERSDFVGLYVHLPLVVLGFVVAAFTRTIGFHWLSLLIIIAELSIVITRFVFSYEQAFMGDLVRYWYSALFLLAAAYTLFEEGHVRVDILYSRFTRAKKGLFNTWGVLLLGIPTAAVILIVGFDGKQSIINSPVMNFEITQTGSIGMFVKYQMAAFLGIFGATMLIQFVAMLFESVADHREEPGHREPTAVAH